MTLKHLMIYVEVARLESITKAAKKLFMTQPSVSLAIHQLEEHYGVKLFDRVKQRIFLTKEGEKLMLYASSIVNSFEDFEKIAKNINHERILSFGCSLSLGERVIPSSMGNFVKRNETHICVQTSSEIMKQVIERTLDIGLIETPSILQGLDSEKIAEDELIIVAKKDYPIDSMIEVNQLSKFPLLLRNEATGVRDAFMASIAPFHLNLNIVIESVSNLSLLEFARNGFGLAIIPNLVYSTEEEKDLKIVRLKGLKMVRPISFVYRKNEVLSAKEIELMSEVKKAFFK